MPRFYEGRTYQGAKATFYPYPVQDVLTDVKSNVTYRALFLENQYLQICVLPELGGRIFSALDKANGYDFFYRQHVIKPALIGMLGAWISGGVEWNVPHHHRATSFSPVDCTTTTNADGSATIWVGEIELRSRMKWLVGMTLYPDRSYLELTCKMFNRTPFAWPMLFWINAAVHANEHYQVIFPPGTEWAAQHAKPEFASWPIAHQFYGGTDYTRGVDISWWKNHPNPVSFFAWNYEDDWFGGYDHGKEAGVVQVSDHHVAPGKKFFEWGNGPEGESWSKILTDEDGPYLELMAGAWSDNQPDYSWIQPGETREWKHWWYPIRNLGGIKAATRDAAVNLEVTNEVARVTVNVTTTFTNATVELRWQDNVLQAWETDLSPRQPFAVEEPLAGFYSSEFTMGPSTLRRVLVASQPPSPVRTPMPKPVERPKSPKDYANADELYFTGQRIEQLYSPSFEAQPYYEEILRRDPGDYRANTAMGILLCKQWRWEEATRYLGNTIARTTANYIRPRDGEAFYYLGVALKSQAGLPGTWWTKREPWLERLVGADDALQKAAWSPAWQGPSFYRLAEIASLRRKYADALAFAERSLQMNGHDPRPLNLQSAILRYLGRFEEAARCSAQALAIDPLDTWARLEHLLATESARLRPSGSDLALEILRPAVQKQNPAELLEVVADYANAGLEGDAFNVICGETVESDKVWEMKPVDPMLALWARFLNPFQYPASTTNAPGMFPFQYESLAVLRGAARDRDSSQADYLLGCLLYDNQPENAIKAWEESRQRDGRFALTHRNLGLAYAQYEHDVPKAIASLEQAVELDTNEPRFFYELDREYEANGAPVAQRLDLLLRHAQVVARRDDALTREIELLIVAGLSDPPKLDRAVGLLTTHHFRNWEGSGQIHNVYVDALLARGQVRLQARQAEAALKDFQAALEYPANLEVGRTRRSPRSAQIQYFTGLANEALGDAVQAKASFEAAATGRGGGGSEADYFRARALQKLGRDADATPIFERLVRSGEGQLTRGEQADYFAKFGEKQSDRVRQANAHYLIGLGKLGLRDEAQSEAEFRQALELHPAHLGAALQAVRP
ncbi:MAG: DUF5107 domain-containing protein [Acidobacteria bacterium]|nr:DUF5107 domain-containing protein [Acidobacteriota bacterium]